VCVHAQEGEVVVTINKLALLATLQRRAMIKERDIERSVERLVGPERRPVRRIGK